MRWRVVSLPEMSRNTSCVRASTSVRRRPSTSMSSSSDMKSSRGSARRERDLLVDVGGELRVRAGEALAALVAVLRGVGALHDLVGPRRPLLEVVLGRAEQVGDHARGHRHHVAADEVDDAVTREEVVEQPVAEVGAERLDATELVHGDGAVDDAADLPVPRLRDLVDELLLVGHDDAGLTEARVEGVDVLGRGEHVVEARQEPHALRVLADGRFGAHAHHLRIVGRRHQRVEGHRILLVGLHLPTLR